MRISLKARWVKVTVVAKHLGCNYRTIERWRQSGRLEEGKHYINLSPKSLRGSYRYNLGQIIKHLEAGDAQDG